MESKELQLKLEAEVDRHMKRTLYLDLFYALIFFALFGFVGGFVFGTECTERFLAKCLAYKALPMRFTLAYLCFGIPIFILSFKSLRGYRRRRRWFG